MSEITPLTKDQLFEKKIAENTGSDYNTGDVSEINPLTIDQILLKEIAANTAGIVTEVDDLKPQLSDPSESLALVPTSEGKALIHTVYGMSVQDGMPTPSVPVDIVSAKVNLRSVGKNLIPYPYYDTTNTINDVTFTDNGDGSVTVVTTAGGATNHSRFYFKQTTDDFCFKKGKTYILTDGVADGGSSNYKIEVALYNGSTYIGTAFSTVNGSVEFTLPNNDTYDRVSMYIVVYKNQVITTPITFKPMLCLADVTDSTFESYKKTDLTTDLTLRAIEVSSSDAYNLEKDGKYYIADTLDYSEDNGFVVTRRIGHIASYNGESITTKWMSSMDVYDSETSPSTGAVVDYILIAEITESITTEQALALLSLKTYDESTSISSQAEPSCTVAIEYAKERLGALALIAHNLAKGNDLRIAELEETP